MVAAVWWVLLLPGCGSAAVVVGCPCPVGLMCINSKHGLRLVCIAAAGCGSSLSYLCQAFEVMMLMNAAGVVQVHVVTRS